jgi:hypothetical protein
MMVIELLFGHMYRSINSVDHWFFSLSVAASRKIIYSTVCNASQSVLCERTQLPLLFYMIRKKRYQ